jgi:hypothetical protein
MELFKICIDKNFSSSTIGGACNDLADSFILFTKGTINKIENLNFMKQFYPCGK